MSLLLKFAVHYLIFFQIQGLDQSSYNFLRADCKVTKCSFQLTMEHSAQISMTQALGSTEIECLARLTGIDHGDLTAVYCPDHSFCGLDLMPEFTKNLRPGYNKSCLVFSKTGDVCNDIEGQLIESG